MTNFYDETILRFSSTEEYWEMPVPAMFIPKPPCRDFCANSHCGIKIVHQQFTRVENLHISLLLGLLSSYFRRNLTEILSFEHCDWRINIMSELTQKCLSSSKREKYIFIIHRLPRYKKLRELFHQSALGPQVLLWRRREEGSKKLMETANMFQLLRLIRKKKNSNLFAASFPKSRLHLLVFTTTQLLSFMVQTW